MKENNLSLGSAFMYEFKIKCMDTGKDGVSGVAYPDMLFIRRPGIFRTTFVTQVE